MTSLIAFHGDSRRKTRYMARLRFHIAAKSLRQHESWLSGRGGGLLACLLETDRTETAPVQLGLPLSLCYWLDGIFDWLPPDEAVDFAERAVETVPAGATTDHVWPTAALTLFTDPASGLVNPAPTSSVTQSACDLAIATLRRLSLGDAISIDDWLIVKARTAQLRDDLSMDQPFDLLGVPPPTRDYGLAKSALLAIDEAASAPAEVLGYAAEFLDQPGAGINSTARLAARRTIEVLLTS